MELKTFIAESLSQILEGIRDAQRRPGGQDIAADGYIGSQGNLMVGGSSGFFSVVDFDVSVTAEDREGGTLVRIADSEVKDGSVRSSQNTNHLKFAVHVRLPKGGANREASASRATTVQSDYHPFDD